MGDTIVNNRIAGTRITVWDVLHYLEYGRSPESIAGILPITVEQVHATVRYIEEHKEEVMAVHRQIEERIARGNPPEVEAKLAETRAKMQVWLNERRRAKSQEGNGDGHPGGR
ncbi:MAG TPA: DUF433 domain-containing protein [Gemmataceae bacterium]|nr:DUF433 domain-containing protein [Gemmataceae bacterium]